MFVEEKKVRILVLTHRWELLQRQPQQQKYAHITCTTL